MADIKQGTGPIPFAFKTIKVTVMPRALEEPKSRRVRSQEAGARAA